MPRPSDGSDQERQRLQALGTRVRQLRGWKGWSQEALAVRSGLSRDFVAKVELGKMSPGLLRVWDLADGLEVGLAELFSDGLPASWTPRGQRPAGIPHSGRD